MTGLLQIGVQFSTVFKPECVPALESGFQRDVRLRIGQLELPTGLASSIRTMVTFVTPMTDLRADASLDRQIDGGLMLALTGVHAPPAPPLPVIPIGLR